MYISPRRNHTVYATGTVPPKPHYRNTLVTVQRLVAMARTIETQQLKPHNIRSTDPRAQPNTRRGSATALI